jgi:1-acyl-sn-glycerol-3-phosphate acyltransferase
LSFGTSIVDPVIWGLLKLFCRIDAGEMSKVPDRGPLIIVTNHINFLEVPMLYLLMKPRPTLGMAKKETWNTPGYSFLAKLWKGIPVDRSGRDLSALKLAEKHLKEGAIVMMAPEGTRTGDGILREARAGAIALAKVSGAPVLPLAHFGGESFWPNFRKLQKTPFHVRVGEALKVDYGGSAASPQRRKEALTELMVALAKLLPEQYHGYYRAAVEESASSDFRWLKPAFREEGDS